MQFYAFCLFLLLLPITIFALDRASQPKQRIIILLGAPASGKGTQAVELSKTLSLPHISTGDILRANIASKTQLGEQAKQYMDKGQLVPDDLVLAMLFARIEEKDAQKGYILDGFPRTIAQAEALDKQLDGKNSPIVINLDVSDDTIIKRALSRQRSDDTLEVVKERLKAYHTQTAPLIDYYTKKGVLQQVDGEKSREDIQKELLDKLSK